MPSLQPSRFRVPTPQEMLKACQERHGSNTKIDPYSYWCGVMEERNRAEAGEGERLTGESKSVVNIRTLHPSRDDSSPAEAFRDIILESTEEELRKDLGDEVFDDIASKGKAAAFRALKEHEEKNK